MTDGMTALALALALFAQADAGAAQTATVTTAPPPGAETSGHPTGAPSEDYPFVAWCYGALRGYLDLHDQMIPEVRRIETAFRPPGRTLAEDMKVYADQQAYGRKALAKFQSAITAAEKASLRPINQQGAAAGRQGRAIWNHGPEVQPRTVAQMWMSWALPAKCETVAASLEQRATLMGATFKVNSLEETSEEPAAEASSPTP